MSQSDIVLGYLSSDPATAPRITVMINRGTSQNRHPSMNVAQVMAHLSGMARRGIIERELRSVGGHRLAHYRTK